MLDDVDLARVLDDGLDCGASLGVRADDVYLALAVAVHAREHAGVSAHVEAMQMLDGPGGRVFEECARWPAAFPVLRDVELQSLGPDLRSLVTFRQDACSPCHVCLSDVTVGGGRSTVVHEPAIAMSCGVISPRFIHSLNACASRNFMTANQRPIVAAWAVGTAPRTRQPPPLRPWIMRAKTPRRGGLVDRARAARGQMSREQHGHVSAMVSFGMSHTLG